MFKLFYLALLAVLIGGFQATQAHALSCGDVIRADVTFAADLHCPIGLHALRIEDDDITVDLNGYRLSGTMFATGFHIGGPSGIKNVTIKNGTIHGFGFGIYGWNPRNLQVSEIQFTDVGSGIHLENGNSSVIDGNIFTNVSGSGVYIENRSPTHEAMENSITENEFYIVGSGIQLCGAGTDYNLIGNNLIWRSATTGIEIDNGRFNQIYSNRILSTTVSAIKMRNASFNSIVDNFLKSAVNGIDLYGLMGSACLAGLSDESLKNDIIDNQIANTLWGMRLGIGGTASSRVAQNQLHTNEIADSDTGIYLNTDAHTNDATGNFYPGVITPVTDLGVGNAY